MRRRDRERWASARTLDDLGMLTSAWLRGEIGQTPLFGAGPDPETRPYISVLAAANRAGFVTVNSQSAGESRREDGPAWCAWAAGFALPGTAARLGAVASGTGLIVEPAAGWKREVMGWYGRYCHPDVLAVLRAARFIHVCDHVAGRNDVLWPALARFAGHALGRTA